MNGDPPDNLEALQTAIRLIGDAFRTGTLPEGPLPVPEGELQNELSRLLADIAGTAQFALSLAEGDLSQELCVTGRTAGSLKALQSGLRHLTWQAGQIAQGDLTQRVQFMGEFSDSFNQMVDRLSDDRSKRVLREEELNLANRALEEESRERRAMENEVREREELYRGIFENSAEGIYLLEVTKEGRFRNLTVNRALAESVGVLPEDLIGKYVDETISPEIGEMVNARYREVTDTGSIVRKDIDLPLPGGMRTFRSSLVPLRNSEGAIDKILGITYDITEQRMTESALRQSEERFRTLIESSLIGVYIAVDGIIRYVNPVISRMVGYPPETRIGIGKSPLVFVHPDDRAFAKAMLEGRMAGKPVPDTYEIRLLARDGRVVNVNIYAVKIPYEGGHAIFGTLVDITDRKRAEEELKRSGERYRDMFEMNNAVMLIIDPETGIIEDANFAASRYYGYTMEELRGLPITAINTLDPSRTKDEMSRAQKSEGAIFQFRHRKKSGEICDVEVFSGPITLGNRKFLYSIIHDVTDRKRAEDAVEAANQLNQKIDTLSVEECMVFAIDEAERLTASKIGFFHAINEKEGTIERLGWSTQVRAASSFERNGTGKFDLDHAGVWADCLRERKPVVHNDYASLTTKKGLPPGHVPLVRDLCVPIFDEDEIVAIISVGNKERYYDDQDIAILTLLASNAWTLIRRKRTEEALRESEEKFRILAETATCAIIIHQGGKWVYANPAAERISGYPTEELLAMNFWEIVHPGYRSRVKELGNTRMQEKNTAPLHLELPIIRKDGAERWLDVTSGSAVFRTGKSSVLTAVDVTDRKHAEALLAESERKYRAIFENLDDLYYRTDMDGIILDLSPSCKNLIGYDPKDLIGKPVTVLYPDNTERSGLLSRLEEAGWVYDYEVRLQNRDGVIRNISVNSHLVRDENGTPVCIEGILRDITPRKQMELALKRSEERYRTLFEDSPIALMKEDLSEYRAWLGQKQAEGARNIRAYFEEHPGDLHSCLKMCAVTEINRAARELFGIQSQEDFIENLPHIFPQEAIDIFREVLITLSSGSQKYESELPVVTLQGEKKILLMKASIVPGAEESLDRILVSYLDITERKRMEDALRQANRKITMLSSITRHDIRNQVTALQLFLQLSADLPDTPPQLAEYIAKEEKIAGTITTQIEFSRMYEEIGVHAPEWQDLPVLVRTVQSQLQIPKEIAVTIEIPPVRIFADRLIEKVFYNLFENTLRHGGRVSEIRILFRVRERSAEIVYEDDGAGISREDKTRLFQKGFGKNTGLGLFLSREILAITGLTIRETGEPGKGARFVITVPPGEFRRE